MYKQGLYHDWVPKPVQLLMIILCTIPFLVIFGVYNGNISEMTGQTGQLTEYYTLGYYAAFIGMTAVMPLLLRTKQYFRSKEIVVGCLLLLVFFSWVCATTDNGPLVVVCSFFIGVFKMMGILEFILPIFFIISPKMDRTKFYPIFYPMAIIMGQLSGYYFSQIAYEFSWEYVYLYLNIYMLVCALLSTILMHNCRASKKLPLYQFDWTGMILFVVSMIVLGYVLVFTKYHGWFQSEIIFGNLVAFAVIFALFILRQKTTKRPFLIISAFAKKNVYSAIIMISLLGIFLAAGSAQSVLVLGILKYSTQTNMLLNLYMVPGVVLGGIISFLWLKHKLPLKGLIILGFAAYLLAHIIIYYLIAPIITVEQFFIPSLLKGVGLCLLYIAVTVYSCENLDMREMLTASSVFIMFRSFVGPALFGSFISWGMYRLQWQSANDMATDIDASSYLTLLNGGGLRLYGSLQIQSIMVAAKAIYGYTIVGGILSIVYIGLHNANPSPRHYITLMRRRLGGNKEKHFEDTPLHKQNKGIAESAPTAV